MDEISNTRIFRLKQRTLPWSFDIAHLPGKTNSAADATSRHPSPANEFPELRSLSLHSEMDDAESAMTASLRHETHDIIAISWERIATETAPQHAGPRLQYITSTDGIWQAHSRCFFLHQPMHQVQQPIDTTHMA